MFKSGKIQQSDQGIDYTYFLLYTILGAFRILRNDIKGGANYITLNRGGIPEHS